MSLNPDVTSVTSFAILNSGLDDLSSSTLRYRYRSVAFKKIAFSSSLALYSFQGALAAVAFRLTRQLVYLNKPFPLCQRFL